MAAIEACRTARLGGHAERCADCGLIRIAYNSCRNRHCPKCQGAARAEWLAARQAELLPVPYFHLVFTLPPAAAEIAFHNKAAVYAILFKAAADTLRTIAADPKHLGAQVGAVAVLHSWGQNLHYHPHVHCIVPGGGPSLDRTRWLACRPGFFLPVRVLSRLFRRLFLGELKAAYTGGRLGFFGELAALARPAAFADRLSALRHQEWVVYAKPPFGGPQQVLAYLGRYTHRVAIANSRLVSVDAGQVAFRWRDWRRHGKAKMMVLAADEFIRRFLLHSLARRLSPHPPLRLPRQSAAHRQPGAVPPPPCRCSPRIGLRSRPVTAPHYPNCLRALSLLWRSHGQARHRAAPRILPSLARYLMTRTIGSVPLLYPASPRDAVASRAFLATAIGPPGAAASLKPAGGTQTTSSPAAHSLNRDAIRRPPPLPSRASDQPSPPQSP